MSSKQRRFWAALGAWSFLVPILVLVPGIAGFIYLSGSEFSDLAITHFPNALWVQRSVSAFGQIPLWSDTILAGYPFFANPLSGLHYPPGWLALFFPLPFGLNLMIIVHLVWAGIGMRWLIKAEGLGDLTAWLCAAAYAAMPKLIAHVGAGHLGMVYAAAWLPWLTLAQRRAFDHPKRYWMMPGLVLGLIFLADVRFTAVAGFLWAAFAFREMGWKTPSREKMVRLGSLLAAILIAMGLGAVLLLPLLEFLPLSTRSLLTAADNGAMSMDLGRLLGLLLPLQSGTAEWVLYPGVVVLSTALITLFDRELVRRSVWGWAVFLLALFWSLGSHLPGFPFLSSLPGLNLLRVPPRMMVAGLFGLIYCAGIGLSALINEPQLLNKHGMKNSLFGLTLLTMISGGLVAIISIATTKVSLDLLISWLVFVGTTTLLHLFRAGRLQRPSLGPLLLILLLADLTSAGALSVQYRSVDEVLAEGKEEVQVMQSQQNPAIFRVYTPSYSIGQQTAAVDGISQINGVDPMQLSGVIEWLGKAVGIQTSGYSVTFPPFATIDLTQEHAASVMDPMRLGLLNVQYVISGFPIKQEGLTALNQTEAAYIYLNSQNRSAAWVEPTSEEDSSWRGVDGIHWTPNRIDVSATGPGWLVLSEIVYPGWKVSLDGQKADLATRHEILRAVDLPAGSHQVSFRLSPTSFWLGLAVSLITGCVIGAAWLFARRQPDANPS